ncbi:hypothetical protein [Paraflavitalea speifideaquila]|uniref:hypothetical protein n=1 Tax=Paraflavitalea speifideaquila TaxID=3076558 RepID=UPI0028E8ABF7|nr:hypothetical protein [Paraflavitalea speifideiaquila]
MRNLARHLDPNHIGRVGLLKSIDYELGYMPKQRAAAPLYTVTGAIGPLTRDEELMLFRIVQEGIQYFIKRSNSSLIAVQVQGQEDVLLITITDKEMQQEAQQVVNIADKLMSMVYSRSALIGASLHVDQLQKNETTIHITFPFSNH